MRPHSRINSAYPIADLRPYLGFGPLLAGPLSELYGRNIVYRLSFFLFWAFTFPVAFAPNMGTYTVYSPLMIVRLTLNLRHVPGFQVPDRLLWRCVFECGRRKHR